MYWKRSGTASLSVLLASTLCSVSGGAQDLQLTAEQARKRIRDREGVLNSEISEFKTKTLGAQRVYTVELKNGDTYRVHAATGRIAVVFGSRFSNRTTDEVRAHQLPLETLEAKARSTLRERFPEGSSLNLVPRVPPHFDGNAYTFAFGEKLASNGAWTDNGCRIGIGADTGLLVSYSDHFEKLPREAHRKPSVSADRAALIGVKAAKVADGSPAEPPMLVFSRGQFYWSVWVEARRAREIVARQLVKVDARTGKVREVLTAK